MYIKPGSTIYLQYSVDQYFSNTIFLLQKSVYFNLLNHQPLIEVVEIGFVVMYVTVFTLTPLGTA